MKEVEFFNNKEVTVTNARFVVSGVTYAMNGVTSVKKHREVAKRAIPIWMVIIGAIMLLAVSDSVAKLVGVLLIGLGIWLFMKFKDSYVVVLKSSSGESQALISKDETYIDTVINALNDSLIHRG